jgi:Rps23 Pro-64 3,4-dihydroxylase Tpa1-like proline 4-hydroxylase
MIEYLEEYENVLDENICEKIIQKFLSEKNKYDGITFSGLNKSIKNTTDFHLKLNHCDEEWIKYDKILFEALNKCLNLYREKYKAFQITYKDLKDTGFQIQYYKKNEGFYIDHHDFNSEKGNYRVLTYLFYLNDVNVGGETDFLFGRIRVKPKIGKCVLFPASWTFPHKGCMPISNDKFVITGWLLTPDNK